ISAAAATPSIAHAKPNFTLFPLASAQLGTMPEVIGSEDRALSDDKPDIVDWALFEKNRAELGPGFIRIISYFREDGAKSLGQIEQAMRDENATALVLPAHTIKGEARQLGAEPLAVIAELIEKTARLCIETHRFPDELEPEVVQLRKLFSE